MKVTGVIQVVLAWLKTVKMNKPETPTRQMRKPALNTLPPATGTLAALLICQDTFGRLSGRASALMGVRRRVHRQGFYRQRPWLPWYHP